MTELLYYKDAYCQNFDATISAVETQDGKTTSLSTAQPSIPAAAVSPMMRVS